MIMRKNKPYRRPEDNARRPDNNAGAFQHRETASSSASTTERLRTEMEPAPLVSASRYSEMRRQLPGSMRAVMISWEGVDSWSSTVSMRGSSLVLWLLESFRGSTMRIFIRDRSMGIVLQSSRMASRACFLAGCAGATWN